jgi:1,2-diacylglycerol 3-beta-glucosyltransferase
MRQSLFRHILFSIQWIVLLAQSGLAFLAGYLLLLAAASQRARAKTNLPPGSPLSRFLIIIPAHDEEKMIGATLDSLAQLDYPTSHFQVHVIADNCSDSTAPIAQAKGAHLHVRQNRELVGKGYALQWLLEQIWQEDLPHDAILFLDADSLVSPNFLRVMSARLFRGEKVIQAYYAVRQPEGSWNSALRYAALAVLHYLRPQGRMVLGGSAGLKGNGMVFDTQTIQHYRWSGSLTEDIEQHMALVLNGERVTFAPDAVVLGEMPDTLEKMHSQHMRWERGRLETARTYVPLLLKNSARELKSGRPQKSFLLFDAAMEHIIPPFSVLAAASGLTALFSALAYAVTPKSRARGSGPSRLRNPEEGSKLARVNLLLGASLILAQMVYLLTGLRQVNAPRKIYLKLLYAPLLIIWKLKQYTQALLSRGHMGWKRTARNNE